MRKIIAFTAAACLLAGGTAFAQPGKGHNQGPKRPVVSYVFSGVVVADATSDAVVVEVRTGNAHVKKSMRLSGATTITVKLAATSRISKMGVEGMATFKHIMKGDTVKVHIRARKGLRLGELGAAKWVRDETPYVAPAPAPEPPPVPLPPDPIVVPPPVVGPGF